MKVKCNDDTCKYNKKWYCEAPGEIEIVFEDEGPVALIECEFESSK